ncbi:hypothetical protein H477_1587 [[Clostridium] sordellii ATCC 9714]|nr:hypothetical protein H477_1587 [[Clostridium] sordellii ATCC 9714] [Paeniclostridium sordellii ATCC 9714]
MGIFNKNTRGYNYGFQEKIGSLMALLTVFTVGAGAASMLAVGVEDMPKSLKEKR